ncbi:MAG: hypothetical protein QUS33_01720 [Dehalococcoidia bacterium]|nr:hypothetical protein [Dehalococcoidia bacterium]
MADHDWPVIDPNLHGMPAQSFEEDPTEERRVGHVGITRAREALYVLAPDHGADAFYDFKVCKTGGEQ